MSERCDDCRFWSTGGRATHGQCRRLPPVFIGEIGRSSDGTIKAAFAYPYTPSHFWCGEHRGRE